MSSRSSVIAATVEPADEQELMPTELRSSEIRFPDQGVDPEVFGFVFQDHHLLPQCSAIENILLPRLALGAVRSEDSQRASELLNRVGLADRAGHLTAELSGGERQRVAVARALMKPIVLPLASVILEPPVPRPRTSR